MKKQHLGLVGFVTVRKYLSSVSILCSPAFFSQSGGGGASAMVIERL
jgi:hypothetical protein